MRSGHKKRKNRRRGREKHKKKQRQNSKGRGNWPVAGPRKIGNTQKHQGMTAEAKKKKGAAAVLQEKKGYIEKNRREKKTKISARGE